MKIDGVSSYHGMDPVPAAEALSKSDSEQNVQSLSIDKEGQPNDDQLLKIEVGEVSEDELIGMLDRVNQYAAIQQVNLQLQVDDETEEFVIRVVDQESGDLIRQIPTEDAIALAKSIDETLKQFFSPESKPMISFISDEV